MFQCFLDLLRGWGFPWPLCGMVLFAQSRVKLCLEGRVGDSHADLKSGLGVSCMLFVHLYGGETVLSHWERTVGTPRRSLLCCPSLWRMRSRLGSPPSLVWAALCVCSLWVLDASLSHDWD